MNKTRPFRTKGEVILERARRELLNEDSVGLGKGLPERLRDNLREVGLVQMLDQGGPIPGSLGAIVVEADQVSPGGDLVISGYEHFESPSSTRVIVATFHNHPNGDPKLVSQCHSPVTFRNCVERVITELGVVEISEAGLVLTEVSPEVSTDEVKARTGTSLHIADDIQIMELWD